MWPSIATKGEIMWRAIADWFVLGLILALVLGGPIAWCVLAWMIMVSR